MERPHQRLYPHATLYSGPFALSASSRRISVISAAALEEGVGLYSGCEVGPPLTQPENDVMQITAQKSGTNTDVLFIDHAQHRP